MKPDIRPAEPVTEEGLPRPKRLRDGDLAVQVGAAAGGMTPEQLDAWADRYIGYLLGVEGLDTLPADSDHEAA